MILLIIIPAIITYCLYIDSKSTLFDLEFNGIPFEPHWSKGDWKSRFATYSGQFELSVVAGQYYYSSPRMSLEDPKGYSEVELAIFTKNGEWASKEQLTKAFEVLGTMGEYEYSESNVSVFGYISVELIEKLWKSI